MTAKPEVAVRAEKLGDAMREVQKDIGVVLEDNDVAQPTPANYGPVFAFAMYLKRMAEEKGDDFVEALDNRPFRGIFTAGWRAHRSSSAPPAPAPAGDAHLDVEGIKKRLDAARAMVSALCKRRGSEGAREWIMSIPAQRDYDPDLVISDSLRDIPTLLEQLAPTQPPIRPDELRPIKLAVETILHGTFAKTGPDGVQGTDYDLIRKYVEEIRDHLTALEARAKGGA